MLYGIVELKRGVRKMNTNIQHNTMQLVKDNTVVTIYIYISKIGYEYNIIYRKYNNNKIHHKLFIHSIIDSIYIFKILKKLYNLHYVDYNDIDYNSNQPDIDSNISDEIDKMDNYWLIRGV